MQYLYNFFNYNFFFFQSNDFTYQNTLGRRSTLGAYYHMNKQPSYTNDHSLNSQYGYNTWGIWREARNLAPSTYSAKAYPNYQKTKSFSIILTTAAFIVLLAVITIAALAFYFSSVKAGLEEPIMGFEGSFRIAKGDLFSTGLKFNHTSSYKQKSEFYKRFVERALVDNGLQPLRTDIWGFGDGPLIKVNFRIFLDVRKLPQSIQSVEEYIKESFFLETTSFKSLYRSLRIDAESVDIKRILDEQTIKHATMLKELPPVPTSQTQLEKRLMTKANNNHSGLLSKVPVLKNKSRLPSRPHSADEEPDIDVENAPVIQGSFEGSFEITKTDADIARRKTTPTRPQTSASSLLPKTITPYSLRVKPRKPGIEKLTTIIPQSQTSAHSTKATTTEKITTTTTKITTTPKTTASTSTTATTTMTSTTTTSTTTTTTPKPITFTTTTTSTTSTTSATTPAQFGFTEITSTTDYVSYPSPITSSTTLTVPKLDANLFASIPILDTQPWKPIHREVPEFLPGPPPTFPTKSLISPTKDMPPQRRIDDMELPYLPDEPTPPKPEFFDSYASSYFGSSLRKPNLNNKDITSAPDVMLYNSFSNPAFMSGSQNIERLGVGASIQPHPLPVPLIDEVVIPPFKPLHSELEARDKLRFDINVSDEKFEHLGGGVIAKKQEVLNSTFMTKANTLNAKEMEKESLTTASSTSKVLTSTTALPLKVSEATTTAKPKTEPQKTPTASAELADTLGEFFMGLLNLTKEEGDGGNGNKTINHIMASNIETETTKEKLEEVLEIVSPNNTRININDSQENVGKSPTVNKPNFLNIKELILKRNQINLERQQNQSKNISTTTGTTEPTETLTQIILQTTSKPFIGTSATTLKSTTKRIRIKPSYANNKPPTILDDSVLFPSHSKWEFVNSSSNSNFGHTGNMRKIFNQTLQAWVSVDVDRTENLTLNDIKSKINNATNIQDISLIFDTLASKLGITPSMPNKVPPFSHSKLKQTLKNDTRLKSNTTATKIPISVNNTSTVTTTTARSPTISTSTYRTTTPTFTTPSTSTLRYEEVFYKEKREPDYVKPLLTEDTSAEVIGAAIPLVGEAEVEVIDPNKYEEMLRSSQFADVSTTEILPKLVTLLPVRSNSGIRTYRPTLEDTARNSNGLSIEKSVNSTSSRSSNRKTHNSRKPPSETVIRGGLKVKIQ
uniref:SEA domain-containing protein n=1 Tax=Glossina brevipalpis TaxID=37001 RepID=A0A1A9W3Z0_9MUSC